MNLDSTTVYDTAARKWIPRTPAIEAAMRGENRGENVSSDTPKRPVILFGAHTVEPPAPANAFARFFLAEVAQKIRAGIAPAEAPKVPEPTPARPPGLAEREAAVEADPVIQAEAEKMAHERGISILDAVRFIERGRTLDAKLAAAKAQGSKP